MVLGKLLIAFTIGLSNLAYSQQANVIHVTVQVTDVTGADVPNAEIELTQSRNIKSLFFKSNESGRAEFEIPVDDYDLKVRSPGFCPFRQFLEPLSQRNHTILAKLQIASCPGPCSGPCLTVYPTNGISDVTDSADQSRTLKVVVTDEVGASILGAHVEALRSNSGTLEGQWPAFPTNTLGETFLALPTGDYSLRVNAAGFKQWTTTLTVGLDGHETIRARLEINNILNLRGDCMSCGPEYYHPEIVPETGPTFTIPLQQAKVLVNLTPRSRHKHGF